MEIGNEKVRKNEGKKELVMTRMTLLKPSK